VLREKKKKLKVKSASILTTSIAEIGLHHNDFNLICVETGLHPDDVAFSKSKNETGSGEDDFTFNVILPP